MLSNLSTGTMVVLLLAIVAGLVGVYGVRSVLMEQLPPEPLAFPVPLASADLPQDRKITMGDISLIRMTGQEMTERGFEIDQVMTSTEQIIGRRLREPVELGQPFMTTNMYLEGTGPSVAERLERGYRAVPIQLDGVRAGNVEPGWEVDVLFRTEPRDPAEDVAGIPEMTVTLFEGVMVLDVENPDDASVAYNSDPPVITLALTPEEAKVVQTVEGRGKFLLAARPLSEVRTHTTPTLTGMTLEELLDIDPPKPPEEPFKSVIYRGTSRQINTFEGKKLKERTFDDDVVSTVSRTLTLAGSPSLDRSSGVANRTASDP